MFYNMTGGPVPIYRQCDKGSPDAKPFAILPSDPFLMPDEILGKYRYILVEDDEIYQHFLKSDLDAKVIFVRDGQWVNVSDTFLPYQWNSKYAESVSNWNVRCKGLNGDLFIDDEFVCINDSDYIVENENGCFEILKKDDFRNRTSQIFSVDLEVSRKIQVARKLASVQKILGIQPIEGADAIERATILGWHLVVKKGEFEVGDLCVYCEIDSLLPKRPEFEFLRPRKFRIRTIRLRGQYSQGIAFPLDILGDHDLEIKEGTDVTEHLNITKYDPPIPVSLGGQVKGRFPNFLIKTNETRIQSVPGDVLERHQGLLCSVTEKLDGTSATYYYKDGEFGVCSRNLNLKEGDKNVHWQVARALGIEDQLRSISTDSPFFENIALQGEIVGPGIQGNKYGLRQHELYLFNVFFINEYRYADPVGVQATADLFGIQSVPVLKDFMLTSDSTDQLVEIATAKSQLNPKAWREGIVVRPYADTYDEEIGRLSFKVISPKFLLKHDE